MIWGVLLVFMIGGLLTGCDSQLRSQPTISPLSDFDFRFRVNENLTDLTNENTRIITVSTNAYDTLPAGWVPNDLKIPEPQLKAMVVDVQLKADSAFKELQSLQTTKKQEADLKTAMMAVANEQAALDKIQHARTTEDIKSGLADLSKANKLLQNLVK